MSELKVDDYVEMSGGKCKKCKGIITGIMKQYVSVRLTYDKKGEALHSQKSNKVKREHIKLIDAPPIEMPTEEDLKPVDSLEPNKDIFEVIDDKIKENKNINVITQEVNPNLVYEEVTQDNTKVVKVNPTATFIDENNVSRPMLSIDDALNIRDENIRLKYQLESMVGFQSKACGEIAELKMTIDKLRDELSDSIRLEKVEELKSIINSL